MTINNSKVYEILRGGIAGGNANVSHRYNVVGDSTVKHFHYD
jgi:protein involved in ribonucleotide reduction